MNNCGFPARLAQIEESAEGDPRKSPIGGTPSIEFRARTTGLEPSTSALSRLNNKDCY